VTPPADALVETLTEIETDRLSSGHGALAAERTKLLIERFLRKSPARVADVGGGGCVYAEWLAEQGHEVELIAPVPEQVEWARERAGDPPSFGARQGDARRLPFDRSSCDAVLLLGPLSHLADRDERLRALGEAFRVCRPKGLLFASAISRYAPLLDSVRRAEPELRASDVPDAYLHLPEELADEVRAAGFEVVDVFGLEGPGVFLPDFSEHWGDPGMRERLLAIAEAVEVDPHLVAASDHILALARKPE
jgi:SAM-dependent methyltransferase